MYSRKLEERQEFRLLSEQWARAPESHRPVSPCALLFCTYDETLALANRMTTTTPVMDRNELFHAQGGVFYK